MDRPKHIAIIGGGLVGSLLSIYLSRRGYKVSVFERRDDPRITTSEEGRSINLALSTRGIRALEEVGVAEMIKQLAIPMHGRMMHDRKGSLSFLPYGKQGQFINSISRNGLNRILVDAGEKEGVHFHFLHRCLSVDVRETSATFQFKDLSPATRSFDIIAGADGAFSSVRMAMQVTERFDYSQHYLEHGYKELHIPTAKDGIFPMEKHALHIWPRESFMMIALPNPDGTFTCTLFLPFEGRPSFSSLTRDENILPFFNEFFPDAVPLMPHLSEDYRSNPTASLVTIRCFPWFLNNTLLMGDAAHAIVPFYGQGMNAGFEDCRILNALLDHHGDNWKNAMVEFQETRKADADAISKLALDNFIEMRDLVADPEFLLRKKIEAKLHELYPEKWIPLYSMVTFNADMRYSDAYTNGRKQAKIMDDVMMTPGVETRWNELDFRGIVDRLG